MGKFCSNCGAEINEQQAVCLKCGVAVNKNNYSSTGKSKIAAALLAFFVGAFGIHNFYLGYKSKATTQLLLTVLSCGILSFVSAIWSFIEAIMLLTGAISLDADGNLLV